MKRFYECVIHPRDKEDCPTGRNDCDNCEWCMHVGTYCGAYYIDCGFGEETDNTKN